VCVCVKKKRVSSASVVPTRRVYSHHPLSYRPAKMRVAESVSLFREAASSPAYRTCTRDTQTRSPPPSSSSTHLFFFLDPAFIRLTSAHFVILFVCLFSFFVRYVQQRQ
jgi:hypothetical protein